MPVTTAAAAATNGAAFGLFPIGWIVLCAIFVYDITVKTGKFEEVRHTIAGLAVDRRIQLLLIAFSFGAFIEGAAGFGTPIAICAAMLIGLGFRPLPAAGWPRARSRPGPGSCPTAAGRPTGPARARRAARPTTTGSRSTPSSGRPRSPTTPTPSRRSRPSRRPPPPAAGWWPPSAAEPRRGFGPAISRQI